MAKPEKESRRRNEIKCQTYYNAALIELIPEIDDVVAGYDRSVSLWGRKEEQTGEQDKTHTETHSRTQELLYIQQRSKCGRGKDGWY